MTAVGTIFIGGGDDVTYEMRVLDGGDMDGSREYDECQYSGSDLIDEADCCGNGIGGDDVHCV